MRGAYTLVGFSTDDFSQAVATVKHCGDFDIGITDASVAVLAGRYRSVDILGFDERHFRAMRPLRGERRSVFFLATSEETASGTVTASKFSPAQDSERQSALVASRASELSDFATQGCQFRSSYHVGMTDALTLCVLLWAAEGRAADLVDYEDKVLALMSGHGGKVVSRFRNVDDSGPTEIQVLEFPSEAYLDAYMNDERRLDLAADRDLSVARTEVYRVRPV